MRSSAVLVLLCACEVVDVSRPIGIVPVDLPPGYDDVLAEAGACWNLQFGTHFVSGADATHADQQVHAIMNDTTCLDATAQVQAGWPTTLAICPERYWSALVPPTESAVPVTPFRVLSHELGHVLNIISHPDNPFAVLRSGGYELDDMFTTDDIALFADANPDFAATTPCKRVIRSVAPGHPELTHCACTIERLDLARPIAVVPEPEVPADVAAALAPAARCFALRYGADIAVRAPRAGDQPAYVDICGALAGRALDRGSVTVCTAASAAPRAGLQTIARVLGVTAFAPPISGRVFSQETDDDVEQSYGRTVQCNALAMDPASGECTCNDPVVVSAPR